MVPFAMSLTVFVKYSILKPLSLKFESDTNSKVTIDEFVLMTSPSGRFVPQKVCSRLLGRPVEIFKWSYLLVESAQKSSW